jgi:mRNA-degrading endonuclease HigB of HigAB toxin-antitoxin module
MNKREINRPVRHVERKRIRLDTPMREGKLKSPARDIGTIWSELEVIKKQEAAAKAAKKNQTKIKLKNLFKKLKNKKLLSAIVVKKVIKLINKTTFLKRKMVLGFVGATVAIILLIRIQGNDPSITSTLGSQDNTTSISGDLIQEDPSIPILLPSGKSREDVDLRRVSPNNSAPSYVFIDNLEEKTINVSQQEIPDRLKIDQSVELEKLAKEFQATNIVQVDENKIYHGFAEKANKQSIIMVKDSMLILISVQGRVSDDSIASYYISLKP